MTTVAFGNISNEASTEALRSLSSDHEKTLWFFIITFILLVLNVYLFICVVIYGTKTKKWTTRTEGGKIFVACSFTLVFGIVNNILQIIHVQAGILLRRKNQSCDTLEDFAVLACSLALYSIYVFLWLRQHLIHSYPVVKSFTPKSLTIFSWTHITITALATVAGNIFSFIHRSRVPCGSISEFRLWR